LWNLSPQKQSLVVSALEKKGPSFDEYLAGGFLANAPFLFFVYIAKSLWSQDTPPIGLETLSMLVVAVGGISAGYLVVRRVERDHLSVGLKTGLSSFLVNLTFSSIVLQGTSVQYGLWILLLFCSTGVLGSYLRRITTGKSNVVR
jgi:hypothetical protein